MYSFVDNYAFSVVVNYRVFQKKTETAQSFTHDIFGILYRKMKIFTTKCSAEIAVYQSAQNVCKIFKYSLLKAGNCYTSAGRYAVTKIDIHVSHHVDKKVPHFIEPSNWPSNCLI